MRRLERINSMVDNQSDTLLGKVTGEHILLISLILVSIYMFQESYFFRDPSGLFPRFISGVIIVSAIILLFRNYVPRPLRALTEDSGDVFSSRKEEVNKVSQKTNDDATLKMNDDETTDSTEKSKSPIFEEGDVLPSQSILANKRFRLTALTSGYVALSYLIGFVWATPAFVIAYSLSVGHRWYVTTVLTVSTYLMVYGFTLVLNVQLNAGVLFG